MGAENKGLPLGAGLIQFSLGTLVFMAVLAGALLLNNLRDQENWQLVYGLTSHFDFHSRTATGYGWPFLVRGGSYLGLVDWSWLGFLGNVAVNGAILFLSAALFEAYRRRRRAALPTANGATRPTWLGLHRSTLTLAKITMVLLLGLNLVEWESGTREPKPSSRGWPYKYSETTRSVPWVRHTRSHYRRLLANVGVALVIVTAQSCICEAGIRLVRRRHGSGRKADDA